MTNPQEGYSTDEAAFASLFNSDSLGGILPGEEEVSRRVVKPVESTENDEETELVDEDTSEDDDGSESLSDDSDSDEENRPLSELSKDELNKLVNRLRKENAKRRVTSNQDAKDREEFEKWKNSQLTEKQRLEARVKELEAEKTKTDREKLVRKVAKKAGLSLEMADRLRGDTEEELLEDAAGLVKIVGKQTSRAASLVGNRGTPVGGGDTPPSDSDWFRNLFENPTS